MHLAVIAFAQGDEKSAWDAINNAKALIDEKALYLKKNLNAIITKFRLYKGDVETAREWLSSYAVSENNAVKFYQLYQILTTIRAKISIGEFSSALRLITNVEKLVIKYRKPLDQIEILILRAIIYWKEKQRPEAIESLQDAVVMARPYGYVRIFANEGAAIIPILQKLYRRYAAKSEDETMSYFIRELLLAASENVEIYPGITGGLEEKTVKLSKQQVLMLNFLAAGKNARQICEATGLKLNTVKVHLSQLYGKLEVNNAIDAVLKANRIGLLEKKG
jgi:LuxR family maltose regulon positive regulatory protein